VLVAIGIASYSIYLIHEPIIAMLEYIQVTPIVAAGCSLLAGFGFWWMVERPLMKNAIRQPAAGKIRSLIQACVPKIEPIPITEVTGQ
jgi:peptidoglycan/LPS O-acetylase OafA/YrhL